MLVVELFQLKSSNESLQKKYEDVEQNYNALKGQIEKLKESNNSMVLREIEGIQSAVK